MAHVDHYLEDEPPTANSIVVAVSAFVLDDADQVLMVRQDDIHALPSGDVEVGETLSGAVVRVVERDTGVRIQVTGVVGVYSDPRHVIAYDNGEVRQEFSICFRGRYVSGADAIWVDQPLLPELTIHPAVRLRIQHGLDNRAEAAFS
jgi:ADP-ribose pyrophosphatase YjhB (NUDIX family)